MPLDSVLVVALPVGGLVVGALLGMIAPLRFLRAVAQPLAVGARVVAVAGSSGSLY